ncbi:hypothetical protein LCGC14_1560700 [marine sediment metagenome]|uniref:Uncharacterized protein n=1 Tax=marine sediment metagenome TaxID=412755 RepID=A0A0F9L3Z2_9ZZZZ
MFETNRDLGDETDAVSQLEEAVREVGSNTEVKRTFRIAALAAFVGDDGRIDADTLREGEKT